MPGHQRSGRTRGARNGRAVVRLLTAAVIALAFGRAIGQPLPGPDGYAAPGAPAGAARRGIDAWVTETSVRAEATLTNNANYGASATRRATSFSSSCRPGGSIARAGGCVSMAASRST